LIKSSWTSRLKREGKQVGANGDATGCGKEEKKIWKKKKKKI
jgi:hypothetical protein